MMENVSNFCEVYWTPSQYYRADWGEKKISCPPLINTSLKELHDLEWHLSAEARYITGKSSTKVKFSFRGPQGKPGWPFLIYKGWVKGKIIVPTKLLDVLYDADLTPNFTKPPSFSLIPSIKEKDFITEDEVLSLRDKNKLLLLKKHHETTGSYRNEVFTS